MTRQFSPAKALLFATDIGLLSYWTLTALGIISVGAGEMLQAWNWSFLPLDSLAIAAGITWSLLPREHPWHRHVLTIALTLTLAAGLMAVSFFMLWGSWDVSWWVVNMWLILVPLFVILIQKRTCSSFF